MTDEEDLAPDYKWYSTATIVLAAIGLVVNITAIVLLTTRNKTGVFHTLLKVNIKCISETEL